MLPAAAHAALGIANPATCLRHSGLSCSMHLPIGCRPLPCCHDMLCVLATIQIAESSSTWHALNICDRLEVFLVCL